MPGLDLASTLEAKFGATSPNKKKNLVGCGTTRGKNWDRILGKGSITSILGSYLKGKIWGTCHLYFWRQNFGALARISEAKFGTKPSRPLNNEVNPGGGLHHF